MLIFLGIVCCVWGFVIVVTNSSNKSKLSDKEIILKIVPAGVLIALGAGGMLVGSCTPFGGYEDPVLTETYELAPTIVDGEEVYAVCDNDECIFYLKKEAISAEGKKTVIEPKYLFNNFEVNPEKNCKMPRVEIYVQNGKSTIWTFEQYDPKTIYKLYVPEGTIFEAGN